MNKIDEMVKLVKSKINEVDELSEQLGQKRSALTDAVDVVNSLLTKFTGCDDMYSLDCLPDYSDTEIREYIHTSDNWLGKLMSAAIEAIAKLNAEQNEINEKLNDLVLTFSNSTAGYTTTTDNVMIVHNTQFGDLIDIDWIQFVPAGKYFVTNTGDILFKSNDEYTPVISTKTVWGSEIVSMNNRIIEKVPIIVEAFFPQYRNKPFTVGFKDGNNGNLKKDNIIVHVIEY